MTIQEFIDYCKNKQIDFDTKIAIRAKDDYFLVPDRISFDKPYFGNCSEGSAWEDEDAPRDEEGDIDYEMFPDFLILGIE